MKRTFLALLWLCILVIVAPLLAADADNVALHQALLDLRTDRVLLCVAAHPDDEDVNTVAYYRMKYGVRTYVVTASRGEGGQNEIGPELYKDLGIVRTFEMRAAGRINGAAYYSLNNIDFGYSKTAAETFEFWGRWDSLEKLVGLIRRLRPDVIITHHNPDSGHGNHQATGTWVEEAFDRAGDPARYPEQIARGLRPHQPQRLFVRRAEGPVQITIPVNEIEPVRGESYRAIGRRSFAQHRSQGMDRARGPGPGQSGPGQSGPGQSGPGSGQRRRAITYGLVKSAPGLAPPRGDLFDGIDPGFSVALDPAAPAQQQIERLGAAYDAFMARRSDLDRADLVEARIHRAAAAVLGLSLHVESSAARVVRDQAFTVTVRLDRTSDRTLDRPIADMACDLRLPEGWTARLDRTDGALQWQFTVQVPPGAAFTVPYTETFYRHPTLVPPPLVRPRVRYRLGDRRYEITPDEPPAIDVVPALEVALDTDRLLVPRDGGPLILRAALRFNDVRPRAFTGHLQLPAGWDGDIDLPDMRFQPGDARRTVTATLRPPASLSPGAYSVALLFADDAGVEALTTATVRHFDVAVAPGLRVGLIRSYDSTLETALEQLGVRWRRLTAEDIAGADLGEFHTIVVDIRAYLARPELVTHNRRLLDYVRAGGNLLVTYHKTMEWNRAEGEPEFAPYPLRLGRRRVTLEDAPITILEPLHPLFRFPNVIGESDWDGWVQERGLYFPAEWDDRYLPLLESGDPGEQPLRGGYLVADYGAGTYIYSSYVWYRQLRALVPGGFRNFANALSLPLAPVAGRAR